MTADAQDNGSELGTRRRLATWVGAAALMAAPVIAMRASDDAASDPGDFIFLAILLAGVGVAVEAAARVSIRSAYRAAVGFALAAAFLHAWINLAVGIIGNEDNPANLIYYAVIAVAAVGALLARFQADGMSRAMVAAAIAQVLAFVAALATGLGFTGPMTVFFTVLWLASAWLFRKAARAQGTDIGKAASQG